MNLFDKNYYINLFKNTYNEYLKLFADPSDTTKQPKDNILKEKETIQQKIAENSTKNPGDINIGKTLNNKIEKNNNTDNKKDENPETYVVNDEKKDKQTYTPNKETTTSIDNKDNNNNNLTSELGTKSELTKFYKKYGESPEITRKTSGKGDNKAIKTNITHNDGSSTNITETSDSYSTITSTSGIPESKKNTSKIPEKKSLTQEEKEKNNINPQPTNRNIENDLNNIFQTQDDKQINNYINTLLEENKIDINNPNNTQLIRNLKNNIENYKEAYKTKDENRMAGHLQTIGTLIDETKTPQNNIVQNKTETEPPQTKTEIKTSQAETLQNNTNQAETPQTEIIENIVTGNEQPDKQGIIYYNNGYYSDPSNNLYDEDGNLIGTNIKIEGNSIKYDDAPKFLKNLSKFARANYQIIDANDGRTLCLF